MIEFVATASTLSHALRRQKRRANLILTLFSGEGLSGHSLAAANICGELLHRRIDLDGFEPSLNQSLVIDSDLSVPGLDKIILVGLGPRSKLTLPGLRRALSSALIQSRDVARSEHLLISLADVDLRGLTVEQFAEVVAEYACLTDYELNHRRTRDRDDELPQARLKTVVALTSQGSLRSARRGLRLGQLVGEATNRARDMVNEPSDVMTPGRLAEIACQIASDSGGLLQCKVLERAEIKRLGMQGVCSQSIRAQPKVLS